METVCHNQLIFESLLSKEVVADFAGDVRTVLEPGQSRLRGQVPGILGGALAVLKR